MKSLPVVSAPSSPSQDPMGEDLQKLLSALAVYVCSILKHPPAEPSDDLHYRDISVAEWRRALWSWVDSPFTRRAHPSEWLAGLRLALDDLPDSAILDFVRDLDS